jgi:hypothetical protein
VDELRAELNRVGASYAAAGPAEYVAVHDLGDVVWLKGPPFSGLTWKGSPTDALERLRAVPDGAGIEAVRTVLG